MNMAIKRMQELEKKADGKFPEQFKFIEKLLEQKKSKRKENNIQIKSIKREISAV